jgi:glucose/arabinose dehydrogenase
MVNKILRAAFVSLFFLVAVSAQAARQLEKIKLPPGFKIELYVDHVDGARSLAMSPSGTLFISTMREKVYAYKDGKLYTVADGLKMPNGIDFHNGALYIAEISRISRLEGIENKLSNPPQPVVVTTDLPSKTHHGWRYMRFGPDGYLYVAVGAPCNECTVEDPFGTILRMKPDGSEKEVYARGIRNSVGFDWDPKSHDLWFTDNGRDNLGNERPPDKLNHASKAGLNFGYPYCHGGDDLDPELGKGHSCSEFVPPVQKIPAHDANLGMRFYTGKMFPDEYRDGIFIAEHGSWNREPPRGYRISRVRLNGDRSVGYEVFAEGWLQDSGPWGRPVDVLVAQDGALLVSDDYSGAVYRISYSARR